jgi:hypothetical protein
MSKEKQNDVLAQMYRDLAEIFDEEYERRRLITPQNVAEKMTAKGYCKQSENTIELPCKVGDTIYRIWNCGKHGKSISEFEVKHIDIDYLPDMEIAFLHKQSMSGSYHFAKLKDFGKTVFLTKEEAEQALAKMNGEGKEGVK